MERVCPYCKGSGQFRVDVSIRRHVSGMSDVISCAYCHGTGKVPSPEPPEKVREVKKILESLYWQGRKNAEYPIDSISVNPELEQLQQAGWGDLKELTKQLEYWKTQAGIIDYNHNKTLEAEAKADAYKEVFMYLNPLTIGCSDSEQRLKLMEAIDLLKQGELPKE